MIGTYLLGLPSQCYNYEILNDASRNQDYSLRNPDGDPLNCDSSFDGTVWYRLMLPAGTMIPEEVVDQERCGTDAAGWMSHLKHPKILGEEVVREICFRWESNGCEFNNYINVTNCGDYYVYKLPTTPDPPSCSLRYCAEHKGNFSLFY